MKFIINLKIQLNYCSGIQAGIYTTNSPEACLHCLKKSYANIVVVQNTQQLEKILQIRDQAAHLKAIVQIEGTPSYPDVLSVRMKFFDLKKKIRLGILFNLYHLIA